VSFGRIRGVEVKDVGTVTEDNNEISIPWKHIVERVKIQADKDRMESQEKQKLAAENLVKTKQEAFKLMNHFFNKYFDDNLSSYNNGLSSHDGDFTLQNFTQPWERTDQDGNIEEGPMVTIRHSLTVNNETQHGVTILEAESMEHLISTLLKFFFTPSVEKTSPSVPSFTSMWNNSTILPYIAPLLLIIAPFFLLGLVPSIFLTVLMVVFGLFALTFLLPFLLPLGGLFSLLFMDESFFSTGSDSISSKDDILQPIFALAEAATEVPLLNITTTDIAEIVTNIPRMFS